MIINYNFCKHTFQAKGQDILSKILKYPRQHTHNSSHKIKKNLLILFFFLTQSPLACRIKSFNSFRSASSFSSTHDYIIVGAGSAGCVLANRLSANPNSRVLLLEAGPSDNTWKIHMPAAMSYNLENDSYNWFYTSEPQENLKSRFN